jgi:hypothetical protein
VEDSVKTSKEILKKAQAGKQESCLVGILVYPKPSQEMEKRSVQPES